MKTLIIAVVFALGLLTPTNIQSKPNDTFRTDIKADIRTELSLLTQDIYHLNNELTDLKTKLELIEK